jgi:hypothetical protein
LASGATAAAGKVDSVQARRQKVEEARKAEEAKKKEELAAREAAREERAKRVADARKPPARADSKEAPR